MHAIFFGVKRVHIETVRLTTRLLRFSALTAARYELMRVVQMHPEGVHQSTVVWLLGVTAPVVSRMLASLEALGFVERGRDGKDRRCRVVRLTERGRIALAVAQSIGLDRNDGEAIAARAVAGDRRLIVKDPEAQMRAEPSEDLAAFDFFLLSVRHAVEDRAPYHHPWQKPPFFRPTAFTTLAAERLSRLPDGELHAPFSA